jgi:hypothetical protein
LRFTEEVEHKSPVPIDPYSETPRKAIPCAHEVFAE